ncbi:hypothetical protein ACQKJC_08875 [Priestia koreensis]|uniref:hypothetical protein n=1 Tax=Priestia koreensis TaxID=284581 RepID=UPI003D01BF86
MKNYDQEIMDVKLEKGLELAQEVFKLKLNKHIDKLVSLSECDQEFEENEELSLYMDELNKGIVGFVDGMAKDAIEHVATVTKVMKDHMESTKRLGIEDAVEEVNLKNRQVEHGLQHEIKRVDNALLTLESLFWD